MTDADNRREAEIRERAAAWFDVFPFDNDVVFLLRRLAESRAAHERRVADLLAANNALLERARAAEERMRWRDIATDPPPVNTSILIWLPKWEHYGPGIYRAILVDMGTGKRWHTTAWAIGRDLDPMDWPTHWRPLPEPPHDD